MRLNNNLINKKVQIRKAGVCAFFVFRKKFIQLYLTTYKNGDIIHISITSITCTTSIENERKTKMEDRAGNGRYYMSSVKIGPKGQIVIPKEARDMFGFEPGDTILLLADKERGIALQAFDGLHPYIKKTFNGDEGEKEGDGE